MSKISKASKFGKKVVHKNGNGLNYDGHETDYGDDCRCDYCNNYFDERLFLGDLSYCINCWSVMDNDNFDCEKLTYDSEIVTIDEVIEFVKNHYNDYIDHGKNKDIENCIFNKIKKAIENDKLHFLLKRELIKNIKKFVNLDNYKKFRKNRNPKVDYNLSVIII